MATSDEPAATGPALPRAANAIQASAPAPQAPPPQETTPVPVDRPLTAEGLVRAIGHLDRFLVGLLVLLAFALASFAIYNSDFWMHLATGRALVEGTYNLFAGEDPFSFTTAGVRWINHSWLYDWAVYGLFGLVGGSGLVVLKGLVVVLLAVVLFQVRRPEQSLWAPVVCVGVALVAMSPRLLFQPTIVSFLFLGITLSVLVRTKNPHQAEAPSPAASPSSSRVLWVLPPLFALWANLDNWFILGPLTVALFLLGDWIQRLFGKSGNSERKSRNGLAAVLGVSLAACLLNPNGLSVFVLPPELAYLVVQVTGPVSLDSLAGGTAVYEQVNLEPSLALASGFVSPLHPDFLTEPTNGLNVAGMSYFVLLALGIVSFILAAPVGIRSGATRLPATFVPRLTIWLVFGLLSLLAIRIIPFFAILAGPIAALNFQDFARWCYGTHVRIEGAWRLWSLGGRLASAAACLGLLFLAWPGWLHTSFNDSRPTHRMAWHLEEDPSLRQAAQRIGELQQTGRLGHGFNYQPEVANYLSWFSPQAKGFCDYRFALFAGCADQYARTRRSLRDKEDLKGRANAQAAPPRHEWEEVFRKRRINYVVLSHLNRDSALAQLALDSWLNQASWVPLYADGHTVVLGWLDAGPRDQFAGLEWDLNRLAFAPVPEDRRAPLEAPELPAEPTGFWLNYWLGPPPEPLANATARLYLRYFHEVGRRWIQPYLCGWQVACFPGAVGTSSVFPGSVSAPIAMASLVRLPKDVLFVRDRRLQNEIFLRPEDGGPPGAGVLAVRFARRAIAKSPAYAASQQVLADAVRTLWQDQEQFWTRQPPGDPISALQKSLLERLLFQVDLLERQTIRTNQLVTALQSFVTLKGDQPQPELVEVHWELFHLYGGMNYLDLALEHLGKAREIHSRLKPPADQEDAFRRRQEGLDRFHKEVEANVKKRREYFELQTAGGKSEFDVAFLAPYRATDERNRVTEDRRGLGLAEQALESLHKLNVSNMPDPKKRFYVKLELALLLTMGRAREVREGFVSDFKQFLLEDYERFEVLLGAATGDYRRADQALAILEKNAAKEHDQEQAQRLKLLQDRRLVLLQTLGFDPPLQQVPVARVSMFLFQQLLIRQPPVSPVLERRIALRELRGLLSLEQGDTGMALIHFRDVLRRAGRHYFPDRPIVEHYEQLLVGP